MTPKAQNQAMAADQKWKPNPRMRDLTGKVWPQDPPDYARDHEAMREAERTLTPIHAALYREALMRTIIDQPHACPADDHAWHASPAQRREAFLKVKCLWKEGA